MPSDNMTAEARTAHMAWDALLRSAVDIATAIAAPPSEANAHSLASCERALAQAAETWVAAKQRVRAQLERAQPSSVRRRRGGGRR